MNRPQRKQYARNFAFHDFLDREESFEEAFLAGMNAAEKAIPCRFLYDAAGSALFDDITELPDYYPTRTEVAILETHAADLARLIGPDAVLIELGSGSSIKTRILLDRLDTLAAYMPVDVSRAHLKAAALAIAEDYPHVGVEAVCADYSAAFPLPSVEGRRVGFFPGSTIGNLAAADAEALLKRWRARLGDDGLMIVGADMKKERRLLEAAYDDAGGVTEAFIKNILARANRELGANFEPGRFRYDARWNERAGRVEMHLASLGAQTVRVAGDSFCIAEGERIHVENSHKYDDAGFAALAAASGFAVASRFIDPDRFFSVYVLAAQ